MHTYIHIHKKNIHTHAYTCTYTFTYTRTNTHTHTHTHTHTYTHTYTHTHTHTHVYTRAHTYTHHNIHIYTYAYTPPTPSIAAPEQDAAQAGPTQETDLPLTGPRAVARARQDPAQNEHGDQVRVNVSVRARVRKWRSGSVKNIFILKRSHPPPPPPTGVSGISYMQIFSQTFSLIFAWFHTPGV